MKTFNKTLLKIRIRKNKKPLTRKRTNIDNIFWKDPVSSSKIEVSLIGETPLKLSENTSKSFKNNSNDKIKTDSLQSKD